MTRKQTSAKVSKIASMYLRMDYQKLMERLRRAPMTVHNDIIALAASCLSQDEVKGGKPKGQGELRKGPHYRLVDNGDGTVKIRTTRPFGSARSKP